MMILQRIRQRIRTWLGLDEDHNAITKIIQQHIKDNNGYCEEIIEKFENTMRLAKNVHDSIITLEKRLDDVEKNTELLKDFCSHT